jgi:diguanylate cyclase (GGDEF)-like protein/PAS domain S-box-containing protein
MGVGLFFLFLLVLGSNILQQKKHVLAASVIFVIGIWLLFTALYVLGGRAASAFATLLLAVIITAGILLGERTAIILAVMSSLTVLGIAILEDSGYPLAHFFPGPPLPSWATWTFAVFFALKPLSLAIQSTVRSAETLRESEERLKYVLEGSQVGYWDWNIETGQVQRNKYWAEMLGYTLEEIQFTVKQWTDLHHPDDRERAWKSIQDHLEGRSPEHRLEYRMRTRDGQYKWILDQAKIVKRDSQGKPLRMSGTHTDITGRKQVEEREKEERALAEALRDSAAALNSTLDFDDVLDRIMDNVGRVVPHDAANLMLLNDDGDTLSIESHRGYLERGVKKEDIECQFSLATMPILVDAARSGKSIATPDTRTDPSWTPFPATWWVYSYLTVPIQVRRKTVGFLNLDSEKNGFINSSHAERLQAFVSHAAIAIENARLYENMQKIAVTDALTGVYNRAFFEAEFNRIERGRNFPVSIIVADLDNMKTTNDRLGHSAGDALLKHTVRVLHEVFRASDIIARIGGDEFVILLPHTDSETTENMLSRIRDKLNEHNIEHSDLPIQLSLGASTATMGGLMDAFHIADQHMYTNKAARKLSQ